MEKINIFIGTSDELNLDSQQLQAFVNSLKDNFSQNFNIHLQVFSKDDFDYIDEEKERLDEIKKSIAESKLSVFLFFKTAQEDTVSWFDTAYKQIASHNENKIYVYFKDIDDLEFPDKSIEEFKVRLENEIGHYCGSYENIDTIKLRILLTLNCDSVTLSDGHFTLQDQIIPNIDITNVSEYANNIKLSNLWNEKNKTSKKLGKIEGEITIYDNIKDRKDRKEKLLSQSKIMKAKLKEIDKKISEIERNIFNLSIDLCKDKLHQKMPADILYAYRQFELGDYEEVLSILSVENIRNNHNKNEEAINLMSTELKQDNAKCSIEKHRTAIKVLIAKNSGNIHYDDDNAYCKPCKESIKSRYEEMLSYSQKYLSHKDTIEIIIEAANTLFETGFYDESIDYCNKGIDFLNSNEIHTNTKSYLAELFKITGFNLNKLQKYAEAEKFIMDSIKLHEEDSNQNNTENIAKLYRRLGDVIGKQNRFEEADKNYKKCMEIYESNIENCNDNYLEKLSSVYYDICCFYRQFNKKAEADKIFQKCEVVCKKLCKNNKTNNNYYILLSEVYYQSAEYYYNIEKFEKSNKLYQKAAQTLLRIKNVSEKEYLNVKFIKAIFATCNNAGYSSMTHNKLDNAERYFKICIDSCRYLYQNNLLKNYSDYLKALYNMIDLYERKNKIATAIEFAKERITVYETLVQEEYYDYVRGYAETCRKTCDLYNKIKDYANAEAYLKQSIEIFEKLADTDWESLRELLVIEYYNSALSYLDISIEQAVKYFNKSADICTELIESKLDDTGEYAALLALNKYYIGEFTNNLFLKDKAYRLAKKHSNLEFSQVVIDSYEQKV